MRNKTSFWERSLAALLSFVMVLSMFPVLGENPAIEAEAAPVDAEGKTVSNYITLPITIRDFAADGMLFEYNEVDTSDTCYKGTTSSTMAVYVNYEYYTAKYDYPHVWQYSFKTTMDANLNEYWQVVFVNSDGSVNCVCRGNQITDTAIPEDGMVIFAHDSAVNYTYLNNITNNTANYSFGSTVSYSDGTTGYYLECTKHEAVYRQADTKGFGLMLTGSNDRIQNLTTTSGPGTYVNNGTYGSEDVPDPIEITLNSGAKQMGYGITIRKDLVAARLDQTTGKPVYTEETITYLANYMSQIMNEPWQNADGSYNSFFVMGTKMFDENEAYVGPDASNAVYDLAQILRNNVTGGLGAYATTMNKLETNANALSNATQCETWFDAAYYLLHYTWRDSPIEADASGQDGYGKYVPQYDSLHLVAKTNDDGSVYYVFNSGYNDTAYNPTTKEIFNTQTGNITAAQDDDGDFYTRGNKLPAARFDPLGQSGTGSTNQAQWLGYGQNAGGNTYGDLVGASDTQLWDEYYDTTNYHLSLEGHAEFVYHYSSNLYFTFTGDDDVYLYINGTRILDLGAAHSIVKATVNMNDVAETCGLQEGQTYSFDFFYLERHGTAANFGIETNIQLAPSGMITTKQGYQNGVSTGYGGPVDPTKPVAYSFTLTNSSAATLENLTFEDTQLGVTLTPSKITLNTESSLENMYVYVRDENNAIVRSYSADTTPALDEDVLKAQLANGLPKDYSITIYNLRYTIPDGKWEADDTFTNVVNTTAVANGKELRGTADWKVQKQDLNAQPFHIYNWVHKGAKATEWTPRDESVTKAELIQPAQNAIAGLNVSNADIVLCNGAGLETAALWSTDYTNVIANLTVGSDDSMTYNSKIPGMVTIYYKIKGIGYDGHVFHFNVITYGVADNIYVLDYGLAVELNGDDFGLRVNDHLTVSENIHTTNVTITGIQDATSNYGDFTWNDPSLKYTPKDIIDNTDSVRVNVRVLETGATEVTKFTGVDMFETVTTAPASVVYYEENFPGITYVNGENGGGNQWVHYETVQDTNPVAGTEQSADQDMNYGSDPNYKADKLGALESDGPVVSTINQNLDTSNLNALQASGIDALNEYFGLGGGDSNGTVNKLEVKETAEVMSFDFTGTGFELISRTTDEEYAVIDVQVKNSKGEIVEQKPVITESKGGDLYQIPIISFTSPTRDTYHVVVKAGTTGNVDRVFYVDGIRIYGPLDEDQAQEYYTPAESQAKFFEVKQMIQNGQMIYSDLDYNDKAVLGFITGTTMVEDTETGAILTAVDDVNKYMSVGPNNELYMDGNGNVSVLTFILTPKADYPDAARTLQIGAHRKANSNNIDGMQGYSLMTYATDLQAIYEDVMGFAADERTIPETNAYKITSGTEMYYTIELDNLTPRDDGSYLIMVAAVGSEFNDTNLALTNFKVAGYTVSYAQTAILAAAEEGNLDQQPMVAQTFNLLRALREPAAKEPEVEQIPVNENLTINSAALSAAKVVSGRTVTLTVKAGEEAEEIVVLDSQGNEVTATRCVRKVVRGVATYTFTWKVTGSSGQALNYSVRVYDADGLASVNAETVTVTIR